MSQVMDHGAIEVESSKLLYINMLSAWKDLYDISIKFKNPGAEGGSDIPCITAAGYGPVATEMAILCTVLCGTSPTAVTWYPLATLA